MSSEPTMQEHLQAIDDYVASLLIDHEVDDDFTLDMCEVVGRMLVQQQVLARALLVLAEHVEVKPS